MAESKFRFTKGGPPETFESALGEALKPHGLELHREPGDHAGHVEYTIAGAGRRASAPAANPPTDADSAAASPGDATGGGGRQDQAARHRGK